MKKELYIKKRYRLSTHNNYNVNLNLRNQKKICIYLPFSYIYIRDINFFKKKLFNNDSYNIKYFKCSCLNSSHFTSLRIKDNMFHKLIIINYNFLNKDFFFKKNLYLDKNIILNNNHKQCNIYPHMLYIKNMYCYINLNTTLKKFSSIMKYYNYWTFMNLHSNNMNQTICGEKSINNNNYSLKDITLGLTSIEIIFESKTLLNRYIIPSNISILTNVNLSYETHISKYIWSYNLYFLNKLNYFNFFSLNISKDNIYEHKSSILLPNNIITSKNYSINNVILKLFNACLNFYNQEESSKICFIFSFNLLLESLVKQYLKNGIIIPSIQFELIVKKMTSFIKIVYSGSSFFNENDIFDYNKLKLLNYIYYKLGYNSITYIPIILGISKSVLASSAFLTSISFQNILKYLIKLSIEYSTDWLTDFKSKIITTDLIKTGSGWYRHFTKI